MSRCPEPGLGLRKAITDVFEFVLVGSGRLTIRPTKGPAILLDKERRIQELLDAIGVEISRPEPGGDASPGVAP